MTENQTVEGTILTVLEAETPSEKDREFLNSLDCEIEIELREVLEYDACPSCLSLSLIKEGRCTTCLECGWSKCSL